MIFSQSCPNYFPFLLSSLPLKLHFGHFPLFFFNIYPIFTFIACLPSPSALSFGYFPAFSSMIYPIFHRSPTIQLPIIINYYQIWIYCYQKCSLCPIHLREYINCALKKNNWKHINSIPLKKIISGNT